MVPARVLGARRAAVDVDDVCGAAFDVDDFPRYRAREPVDDARDRGGPSMDADAVNDAFDAMSDGGAR